MAKQILLTNIGNRNLLFKENGQFKTFDSLKFPDAEKKTFREITEIISKQLNDNQAPMFEVKPNIINYLLDFKEINVSNLEKLVIYATDQKDNLNAPEKESGHDKDTIYEAKILKILLEKDYPNLEIEIISQEFDPTDNNKLLRFYLNDIKKYKNTNLDFLICDSGGTPQQKMALKIASEYLLERNQYKVYYVSHKNNKSEINPIEPIEYRKVIDSELAIILAKRGEFSAAKNLIFEIAPDSFALHFSNFLDTRTRNKYPILKNLLKDNQVSFRNLLKDEYDYLFYKNTNSLISFNHQLNNYQLYELRERLLYINFLDKIENIDNFILKIHIFSERYLYFLLKSIKKIDINKAEDRSAIQGQNKRRFTLQQIEYLNKGSNLSQENKMIVENLERLFGYQEDFSILRNELVHNGISYSKEELFKKAPSLKGILGQFNKNFNITSCVYTEGIKTLEDLLI